MSDITYLYVNGMVYETGPTGTATFPAEFEDVLNALWKDTEAWNPFAGWKASRRSP